MILVVGFALIVAGVVARGGRLANLTTVPLRWVPTVAGAIVIQVLVVSVLPGSIPLPLARGLHLSSYGLAVVFMVANRKLPGLWLVGLGGMCNLVAIAVNAGVMPASRAALAAAGIPATSPQFTNSTAVAHAHLAFLGDVFATPHAIPLANVFSVGDVLLLVGAALMLHRTCVERPPRHAPTGGRAS